MMVNYLVELRSFTLQEMKFWDLDRNVDLKINFCCLESDSVRRGVSLGGLKDEGKRKCRTECFSVNYQRD